MSPDVTLRVGAGRGLSPDHARLLRRLISLLEMLAELGHYLLGEQHHRALMQLRLVPVLVRKQECAEIPDLVDECDELVQIPDLGCPAIPSTRSTSVR